MAYAVSVFFDATLDAAVREVWKRMAQTGISSSLMDGRYRPHLTLAIYEALDVPAFTQALDTLAASQKPFSVSLAYSGVFTGAEYTLFFAATMTQPLFMLHQCVHSLLHQYGQGSHAYYEPDLWNPHCSLACQVEESILSPALALCLQTALPLRGIVEGVGIIETPAERELSVCRLRG